MQELRQSTEIKVRIGPVVAVGDGFTPVTTLDLSTADEAELLKQNGAATVSLASATMAAVTGCDGYYDLTLTTSFTDTLGQLTVAINDDSLCLPVRHDFLVVTSNYWDSKYSTDYFDVSVVQWLGTACATPTTGGVPEVDITYIGGDAQSLTDLKDLADTGYDPVNHWIVTVNTVKSIDTDGITAASIAANAIGASELATDAVNEIRDAILADSTPFNGADIALIVADTNELQTDDVPGLIAALNDPTAAAIADAVWDEMSTGHVDAGKAGAQLWTDIDAILADTDELQTDDIPGLIAALNDVSTTEVNTEVASALATYDPPTKTEMDTAFAALNDLSAAEVNAEVDSAIETYHLDHLFAVDYDPASPPGVATAWANEIVESDGGVTRFTANALENAPGGSSSDPGVLYNDTFNVTSQTELALQGSASPDDDAYNNMVAVITDQTTGEQKSVRTITDYAQSSGTITIDSAPDFTVANGDYVAILSVAPGSTPPTASQIADAVWDELATGHTDAGKAGAQLWTDIDAILADTDELQTDDVPGLIGALNDLSTSDVNTEVASALATYDPPTKTEMDSGFSGLNDPTAAAIADAVWDEAATGHTEAGKAGAQLWTDIDAILADTDELQTDDVPGLIAALNDVSTTEVNTEVASALATYDPPTKAEMDTAHALLATAASLTTVEGKIDTIDGIVDNILMDTAEIGTAGAGLTDLGGMSTGMKAEVQAECDTALASYDAVVPADLPANFADLAITATTGRVDVGKWLGTAVTLSSTTQKPEVDAYSISDDATAANNCELFYDGTGYAGGSAKLDVNVVTIEGGDATNAINAEVVDALTVDTLTELSQGIPPATPTIQQALMLMYMRLRNKLTVTSTELGLYNDAGTKIAKKTLSDDASTYTETEMVSGA